jgi:hypothetical protein
LGGFFDEACDGLIADYNVDRQHSNPDWHFVNVLITTFQEIQAHDIVQWGLYEEVCHRILCNVLLPTSNCVSYIRHIHVGNLGITSHNETITNQTHQWFMWCIHCICHVSISYV